MKDLAKAYPRKSFFIQMFTKDISLEDCILDLIDNSIDGIIRSMDMSLDDLTSNIFDQKQETNQPFYVKVKIDERSVSIEDNCGGISYNQALNEIFNFGHSNEYDTKFLGVYGVGMKRALFKIGDFFKIVSSSSSQDGGFKCELDVSEWKKNDDNIAKDWTIPIERYRKENKHGTSIKIDKLHPEVIMKLKGGDVETRLYKAISETYCFFIQKIVKISINGKDVDPFMFPIGRIIGGNISYESQEINNVAVKILATISSAIDNTSKIAGWYIVCNGRVVKSADKSSETGWGTPYLPMFMNKFNSFIGIVIFIAQDPLLLPWTTTKRNLNEESEVYQLAKSQMSIAAKPVLNFLNKKYNADNPEPVEREMAKDIESINMSNLPLSRTVFSTPKRQSAEKDTVRIQFDAKKVYVDRIKKILRKNNISAGAVGQFTFDYYLEKEGLK